MLRLLSVLRCALSTAPVRLNSTKNYSAGGTASGKPSDSSLEDPSFPVEAGAIEEIESLSNEVFSRGNVHLKNVETLTALPEGLHSFPEVCFIGKPNCGKSSLISCLLHNVRLGKAGATGGTTRLLQFFNVGDAILLVDTPGYGGWKGRQLDQSQAERANAFSILFRYLALRNGSNLKRVYWLMESSARSPMSFQPRDEEILTFLFREHIPFSVILTKIDRHWRMYADQQRTGSVVGKDGLVHPGHAAPEGCIRSCTPLPEAGVARNMREVFDFLGTDTVPILGVSANRKQPARSRNIELVQHDIVHYCVQDLLPGEALSLTNLRKLSYAPPTADRIQEVQLRYPVESFVVPQNNNLSLSRMVEQHEQMKARFMMRNVSAARLTAKDVTACHLGSIEKSAETLEEENTHRLRLGDVLPSTTFLVEVPSHSVSPCTDGRGGTVALPRESTEKVRGAVAPSGTSLWHKTDATGGTEKQKEAVCLPQSRRSLRSRPRLAAKQSLSASSSVCAGEWHDICDSMWQSEDLLETPQGSAKLEQSVAGVFAAARLGQSTHLGPPPEAATPLPSTSVESAQASSTVVLHERTPPSLPLPALMDPNAHYVTAIDGTRIPRSMISVSVEQLAVNKEDELTHFATKSGAGAYEELLLLDEESGAAADPFTEADDFARLPEAVQSRLVDTKRCRTRSTARKQEERFLAKYVEKKRKERAISMQAEGYMCPWLGAPEKRDVVRGLRGRHNLGTSGAIIRGLKQTGFGGKSYSARTMKHKGRATKKTGSWAA